MYAGTLSLVLLVILSVHGADRAAAQASGFHLGAGPSHISIRADSDEGREREWGGGLFVRGGYNLVPWAGVYVEGSRGSIAADGDHFSLWHGEVGMHLALADAVRALVPIALAGRPVDPDRRRPQRDHDAAQPGTGLAPGRVADPVAGGGARPDRSSRPRARGRGGASSTLPPRSADAS